MPDNCMHHKEHEYRIASNSKDIKELQNTMKNQPLMLAVIGLLGTMFSGCMAFAAVVTAPILRAWLGV